MDWGSNPHGSTKETMNEVDIAWLAGLLEGEGSFLRGPPSAPTTPVVKVQMTDRDIIERVAVLFGVGYVNESVKKEAHWKTSYQTMLRGSRAVTLMQLLRPFMGVRRQQQIDVAIASYKTDTTSRNRRKLSQEQVDEIRRRIAAGESAYRVAKEFQIAHVTVRRIRDFKIWKSVVSEAA